MLTRTRENWRLLDANSASMQKLHVEYQKNIEKSRIVHLKCLCWKFLFVDSKNGICLLVLFINVCVAFSTQGLFNSVKADITDCSNSFTTLFCTLFGPGISSIVKQWLYISFGFKHSRQFNTTTRSFEGTFFEGFLSPQTLGPGF